MKRLFLKRMDAFIACSYLKKFQKYTYIWYNIIVTMRDSVDFSTYMDLKCIKNKY